MIINQDIVKEYIKKIDDNAIPISGVLYIPSNMKSEILKYGYESYFEYKLISGIYIQLKHHKYSNSHWSISLDDLIRVIRHYRINKFLEYEKTLRT